MTHYLPPMFRFYLIRFQLNADFPSQFCIFTVKSSSITQRLFSQETSFKKSTNPSAFFPRKTIGLNNSFTLIENNFRFFEIVKLRFKVTVHYDIFSKYTPCKNFKIFKKSCKQVSKIEIFQNFALKKEKKRKETLHLCRRVTHSSFMPSFYSSLMSTLLIQNTNGC